MIENFVTKIIVPLIPPILTRLIGYDSSKLKASSRKSRKTAEKLQRKLKRMKDIALEIQSEASEFKRLYVLFSGNRDDLIHRINALRISPLHARQLRLKAVQLGNNYQDSWQNILRVEQLITEAAQISDGIRIVEHSEETAEEIIATAKQGIARERASLDQERYGYSNRI